MQHTHKETAQSFIQYFIEEGPRSEYETLNTYYRGVSIGDGVNEHRLLPTAMRPPVKAEPLKFLGEYCYSLPTGFKLPSDSEFEQCLYEMAVLSRFYNYADGIGVKLPELTLEVRTALQEKNAASRYVQDHFSRKVSWPAEQLWPIIGLAQHYGLPTRFLDWTRNPLYAMFFASFGAMKRFYEAGRKHEKSTLAVWRIMQHFNGSPLSLVTSPAYFNEYLRAQQGVFTVWQPGFKDGLLQTTERRPLDEVIGTYKEGNLSLLLEKVTLPCAESPQLLNKLRILGVTPQILRPDLAGVVDAVKNHHLLNMRK
ncbi:FRG domain-containing protein [Neorhodopirellula lusitana]|uniref:FRG domain-containing protein n=1 Tax=Neorhodopirellula lusitana TaxID=445327 RepID=UPI00385031B7